MSEAIREYSLLLDSDAEKCLSPVVFIQLPEYNRKAKEKKRRREGK